MRDSRSVIVRLEPRRDVTPEDEYRGLLKSFVRHLKAEHKSPSTIRSYVDAATTLHRFLVAESYPVQPTLIKRAHLESFAGAQLDTRADSTARTRMAGLRAFFRWLVREGELTASPLEGMKLPTVGERPPPILTEAHLKLLFKSVEGRSFKARRDQAMLRLLLDTGMRRGELAGLTMDDVDLDEQVATVHAKGNRIRRCPFGAKTTQALDRYLRLRSAHRYGRLPQWWIGPMGALSGDGIYHIITALAERAGLPRHIWPHLFRHQFASGYLESGGQEGDLMRLGGWRSPQMMRRYGSAESDRRAIEAYRQLPSLSDRV